jgi:glycosyltransferase involved in cell wall biosynthesis
MRILAVSHQYPPAIGGSEQNIADLCEELASRGHQVDVYTSRSTDYNTWKNELEPRARVNGVDVYRFRSLRRTWLAWQAMERGQSGYWRAAGEWRAGDRGGKSGGWYDGARLYQALALLGGGPICPGMVASLLSRASEYDLIHLNALVYSHCTYAYLAARRRGVPVVISPYVEMQHRSTYDLGYQGKILSGSDHVLVVTEGERAFLMERGLSPWRVTTGGCGVRTASYPARDAAACRRRLGLAEESFVALFLGRQVKYKGLATALEAFALMRSRAPKLELVVAGPETDYSRRLFRRWGGRLGPRGVRNLGRVSDEVRLDLLNACDCLVLPSPGESFGIVYLEAWTVGKPVIGARTPAVSTVIDDGVDGWLVPAGDSVALARALSRWIEAPHLARQMGERGRSKVLRRYTRTHVADVVEGAYLRVLRARRGIHTPSDGKQEG